MDPVYLLCPHNLTIWPDFTLIFQPTSHNRRSSVFLYPAIFEQNHFLWCGKLCPKLFILFCLKHGNFLFSWLFLYNRPKVFKWKRKFFNVFRRSIMSVKGFYPLNINNSKYTQLHKAILFLNSVYIFYKYFLLFGVQILSGRRSKQRQSEFNLAVTLVSIVFMHIVCNALRVFLGVLVVALVGRRTSFSLLEN